MNWRVAASTYWCWTAAARRHTAVGMGHLVAMDDNPAELALSDYSIQAWRTWAADLPEDCAYRNCGTLWLAADAAELAEAERKRQALLAAGVACEMLDAARLRDLEPVLQPGLAGALKVPGDGISTRPTRRAGCSNEPARACVDCTPKSAKWTAAACAWPTAAG